MSEQTSGLYKLITIPQFYAAFQNLLGGAHARNSFKTQFFDDLKGKSVLEVGCGPGTWIHALNGYQKYLGMDWNKEHISIANMKFQNQHTIFKIGDVSKDLNPELDQFDYIFGFGILHHLEDGQCQNMLSACAQLLANGGKLITIDPVYHEGQHFFAKWMADRDSGQNVREASGYRGLAESVFNKIETHITTDKLRIPYSHCIMVASH